MAGSIKGITIELDGNATKLNKALSTVNKAANQTQRQLKNIDKALKFNPGNTDLIAQKFKLLSTKIQETKQKLDLLKQAEKEAAEQLARGEISQADFDALQAEIAATEAELKKLENEYKSLGSVGAQQVAALGAKMDAFGQKIAGVGDKLTTRLTLPLAAIGTAAVKNFAEVDKTMTLTNSTMGNTAEQANLLTDAMKSAAANSTYGMQDAATATLNFARAGLDAEQAAAALAPAMNLAAGEGGELDVVSGGLVATINGFHGSFDEAAHYADVFANACNNSALDVNSLSNAMSVAAPIFSAAGYTVNDAALYMGVMANNGIEADKAANSLKTGLARLVSPAKEGAEMMKQLGIEVTNSDGSMKDSVQIQHELHDAFSQLSESEQIAAASAIFGKNQMAPWLALINTAPGDVEKLSLALEQSGTAGQMASDMMGGFGGALEKLKSSLDVAGYSLGSALAPTISKVGDAIQKAVDWFNALPPSMQTTIATVGLIAAALGPVLAIGGRLISGIGKLMTLAPSIVNAFSLVKGAFSALGGIFTALSPTVLIVIGVIAALVAVGVLLYKNWDTIKEKAQEVWEAVTTAWNNMVTAISGAMKTIGSTVSSAWDAIKGAISNALSTISNTVTTVWNSISSFITTVVNAVRTTISSVWSTIAGTVSTIWNNVVSAVNSAFSPVKEKVSSIVDNVKNKLETTWSGVAGTVKGIFEGIKNAMTAPLDAAKEKIRSAIDAIKGFFNTTIQGPRISLPKISVSGKFSLNPPSVPHFSVSWHKDAYTNPLLFTSPTVLGAHGFGDGNGGEMVIGENYLYSKINEAINASTMAKELVSIKAMLGNMLPQIANKSLYMSGADLIYANRNNINRVMGAEAQLTARGVK